MIDPAFISPIRLFPTVPHRSYLLHSGGLQHVTPTMICPARRAENAAGNLYVDGSCIDCDTCRWFAPETFHIAGRQAAVHAQPISTQAQTHAFRALMACPTGSIRTETPVALSEAISSFPFPVTGTLCPTPVPDVFYNGFTSKESYGCASWLLLHRGSNPYAVMFDCPRFSKILAEAIKQVTEPVGGVRYIVLSHYDDVAWNVEWAEELGAERVIHEAECKVWQGTDTCEVKLSDKDFPYKLGEGAEILHLPGHTMGSIALLHRPSNSLFTGDHLAYLPRLERLTASTKYCKYSWNVQIDNVEGLKDIPFLHGWPGHCRPFHFKDEQDRRRKIQEAVEFMRMQKCHNP